MCVHGTVALCHVTHTITDLYASKDLKTKFQAPGARPRAVGSVKTSCGPQPLEVCVVTLLKIELCFLCL